MTPGSWRAASTCGTWLWWPCPRRGLSRSGARERACRWHTDWRGQEGSIHPESPEPACLDELTLPFGCTFRKSDPGGMRLYGLCKTLSLGALTPDSLFSLNFLVILSTRRTSCEEVLCLDPNLNYSSRIRPRPLTSCKILTNRMFWNILPIVCKILLGR